VIELEDSQKTLESFQKLFESSQKTEEESKPKLKITLIHGHVLDALKLIPSNSVDCIVTSPPYTF